MELYKKLQQYGQFGEGDVPALRDIVVLAEEVARRSEKLDELYFFTATDCDDDATQRMLGTPGPCPGDATRLLGMIEALVDGRSEAAGFDNLWATLSGTHGRWDEGEIDDATAKTECDAAINEYLGRPPCDPEHINMLLPEDDTKVKWEALIEDGAFVTMTVPVQVALMVVDNEAGDAHANAVFNLEEKLCEDFLEEYGVDEEGAWKINEALSNGGA